MFKNFSSVIFIIVFLIGGIGAYTFLPDMALASESQRAVCVGAGGTWDASEGTCSDGGDDLSSLFATVANILLFIIGAIAVIMLIVGGFRYVTSGGDPNAISGAKNTILYAVVGIVVAFLAWAAVDFLVESLMDGQASTANGDDD